MIWSECPGHVKSDGPGGLNACPICNPPRTLADDGRALQRALADFGWSLADALHIQQFVDWLSDRLDRRAK